MIDGEAIVMSTRDRHAVVAEPGPEPPDARPGGRRRGAMSSSRVQVTLTGRPSVSLASSVANMRKIDLAAPAEAAAQEGRVDIDLVLLDAGELRRRASA